MSYVYRYTDLSDKKIKYVGIVWSNERTLLQRIREHTKQDEWCRNGNWKIEYIKDSTVSRTDVEFLESHLISLYNTDKWFNDAKEGWGVSKFIPDIENEWKEYIEPIEVIPTKTKKIKKEPKYKQYVRRVLSKDDVINCILDDLYTMKPKERELTSYIVRQIISTDPWNPHTFKLSELCDVCGFGYDIEKFWEVIDPVFCRYITKELQLRWIRGLSANPRENVVKMRIPSETMSYLLDCKSRGLF